MEIHGIHNGPFSPEYNPKHLIYNERAHTDARTHTNKHKGGNQCAQSSHPFLAVCVQSLLKSTRHFFYCGRSLSMLQNSCWNGDSSETEVIFLLCHYNLSEGRLLKNHINVWHLSISPAPMVMCQVLGSTRNAHQSIPLAYSRSKSCSTAISFQSVSPVILLLNPSLLSLSSSSSHLTKS